LNSGSSDNNENRIICEVKNEVHSRPKEGSKASPGKDTGASQASADSPKETTSKKTLGSTPSAESSHKEGQQSGNAVVSTQFIGA
jgi:hypothetical protein